MFIGGKNIQKSIIRLDSKKISHEVDKKRGEVFVHLSKGNHKIKIEK